MLTLAFVPLHCAIVLLVVTVSPTVEPEIWKVMEGTGQKSILFPLPHQIQEELCTCLQIRAEGSFVCV